MLKLAGSLAVAIWCCAASPTFAACRQALALGLDVSGSVDATEYDLQRRGLAAALTSDKVSEVLLRQPDAPVVLYVYEWSGPAHQHVIQPWIALDPETLPRAALRISNSPRMTAPPTTALGSAILFGVGRLLEQPDCWRLTLDISGDGKANTGPRPQDLQQIPRHVTINALVIGSDDRANRDERQADIKELSSYFSAYVIRGSDPFVETALGFTDYASAMERKLLRELQSIGLSHLGVAPRDHESR